MIMASQKDASTVGITKRKHNTISIQDKVEVLEQLDRGVPVRQLCQTYGIGKTTVVDIKRRREKILAFYANCTSKKHMSTRKTMKDSKSTEHDRIMIEWFKQKRSEGVAVSCSMLKSRAKLLHKELKLKHKCFYSDGWLNRFKNRHGITFQKYVEKRFNKLSHHQDTPNELAEEFSTYEADENLSLEVYNTDENSMYWRCTQQKSLIADVTEEPAEFKRDSSDENLSEWVQVNNETPIVPQQDADAGNISSDAANEIKINQSDDEDDYNDMSVGLNIDRLIKLMTELIEGLGQHTFVTEQELINFRLMYEKLHKERSKFMKRQVRLGEMIKNAINSTNSTSSENTMTTMTKCHLPRIENGAFVCGTDAPKLQMCYISCEKDYGVNPLGIKHDITVSLSLWNIFFKQFKKNVFFNHFRNSPYFNRFDLKHQRIYSDEGRYSLYTKKNL